MKTLLELKKELEQVIDEKITQLKKRYAHGNYAQEKLEEIKKILQEPNDETSTAYQRYYEKVSVAISKMNFLYSLPGSDLKLLPQHLREVEKLIAQKQQEERKALKSKLIKKQTIVNADDKLNPANLGNLDPEKATSSEHESAQVKNTPTILDTSDYPSKNKNIAFYLLKYSQQLRKDDCAAKVCFGTSIKEYKANKLAFLAQAIEKSNENNVQKIITEAKTDKKLIQGFFKHHTRNLFDNILNDDEANYINKPRPIR